MPRRNTIIGFDIGSSLVRAVWVEQTASGRQVVRREELKIPTTVPNLQRQVRPWVEKNELNRQHCVIGLSGQETVFQPMTLKKNDPRTPAQAATMEVAKFSEMASEQMTFDASSFHHEKETARLLIAMARPETVNKALNLSASLGVSKPLDLIPRPYALYRAASPYAPEAAQPTLYVHVGHAGTELAIGTREGILFARAFSCGGRMFTEALVRKGDHSLIQAENHKQSLPRDQSLPADLKETAAFWLTEFKSCLAVYNSTFTGPTLKIGQILISGGGSRLAGLLAFIREQVEPPIQRLEDATTDLPFQADDAIAFGNAVACLDETPETALSLIPQRLKDEAVFKREKPYWIATAAFAALSLTVFLVSAVRVLNREQTQLQSKIDYANKQVKLIEQIEATQKTTRAFHQRSEKLQTILTAAPRMRELIRLISRSIHPDDWVSMVCDWETYFTAPKERKAQPKRLSMRDLRNLGGAAKDPEPVPAPDPSHFDRFIIEGYTPNRSMLSVKTFIGKLKTADFVEEVDLLADNLLVGTRWEGTKPMTNLTQFVIQLKVTQQ